MMLWRTTAPWGRLPSMMRILCQLLAVLSFLYQSKASVLHPRAAAPKVVLDSAVFTGLAVGPVNKFLGIPFAESTTGKNRFNKPVPVAPYTGTHDATAFGPTCPQQGSNTSLPTASFVPLSAIITLDEILAANPLTNTSEDCLSVNVVAPATAKPGDDLPVLVWIYGGGFENGGSSAYDGAVPVNRSIAINEPVIYVSLNYRLAAWGFLASREVKEAGVGNLGLRDQRLAFKWVQKYIRNFGGDPRKVTIWGESAGAVSVSLQLVTNNGDTEGLFRGGFIQSGGTNGVGDITTGQPDYDAIVKSVGCEGSKDTLECLREAPEEKIQAAVDESDNIFSFRSLNLVWQPRVDGIFLKDDPQRLVLEGSVADVPFITGNNDDEGTLFTLVLGNITTNTEFLDYIHSTYLPTASASAIAAVGQVYPDDITQGSPFDTGTANAGTPEYKRLAAFQGDFAFQAPRRLMLNQVARRGNTWSFLNKRLKSLPFLGSAHGSDLAQTAFGEAELLDYLIHFVNHQNPNGGANSTLLHWPAYSTTSRSLLTILDGDVPLTITKDTYREEAMNLLTALTLEEFN